MYEIEGIPLFGQRISRNLLAGIGNRETIYGWFNALKCTNHGKNLAICRI